MADGHTCECSSKIGFPSSQNHSQISNSANTTRHNTEQDNLVVKSSLELTWTGDFKSLKSFVCNNMKLQGEWTQPGGDKKVFTGNSFCVTWRKGKKLLNFEVRTLIKSSVPFVWSYAICKNLNKITRV